MARHSVIHIGNTARVTVSGLRQDTVYSGDETTVQLLSMIAESTGDAVTGLDVPLDLTYSGVEPANGTFRAVLPASIELADGEWYVATIRATKASAQWQVQERIRAAIRRA